MDLSKENKCCRKHRFAFPGNCCEIYIFFVLLFQFALSNPSANGKEYINSWNSVFYFLTYKYGFKERLFIGSIYDLFSDKISSSALYYSIVAITLLLMLGISFALGRVYRKLSERDRGNASVFLALFLTFPFCLSFLFDFDNLGRLDLFLIIYSLLMLVFVSRKKLKWLVPVLCVIALATHQGYMMTYMPLIGILLLYEVYRNGFSKESILLCAISYALMIGIYLYFQFGDQTLPFAGGAEVIKDISSRTDLSFDPRVIDTEYYMGFKDFFFQTLEYDSVFAVPYGICLLFMSLPMLTILIVLWKKSMKKAESKLLKFVFLVCILAPFGVFPSYFGNDWLRWISATYLVQFGLVFYFLNIKEKCVCLSVAEISLFFKKHCFTFIMLLVYQMTLVYSKGYYYIFDLILASGKNILDMVCN